MKKQVYSTEFKSEAVRLSYQRENIKELADELGVQVQRIYKWRAGQKTKASPKATIKLETDSIEVKRLRKALKKKELPTRQKESTIISAANVIKLLMPIQDLNQLMMDSINNLENP